MSAKDIERLAKVAASEMEAGAPDPETPDRLWLEDGYYDPAAVVRAILQALREPSEEMIEAGGSVPGGPGFCDEPGDPPSPYEIWQAMIDAALGVEKPEEPPYVERLEEMAQRLGWTMTELVPKIGKP